MNAYLYIKLKTVDHMSAKNVLCDQHFFITTGFPTPICYNTHCMRTAFLFVEKKLLIRVIFDFWRFTRSTVVFQKA